MNTAPELPAPSRESRCPVCGAANECAPARTGSFASPCWCDEVTIGREALAHVPADQIGRACLCRACAGAGATSRTV